MNLTDYISLKKVCDNEVIVKYNHPLAMITCRESLICQAHAHRVKMTKTREGP